MKKINYCANGGYGKFQLKLVAGSELKCQHCNDLMEIHSFSREALDQRIEDWINGVDKPEKKETKAADDEPAQPKRGRPRRPVDGEEDADADASRDRALAYLKTLEPTIILLPPGAHGKRLPYQCRICTSPKWPNGKVGELTKMRETYVMTFIGNHLKSDAHKKALRKEQQLLIEPQVECQGILISNAAQSGVLHDMRHEFHIWASMANFEECGKHSYQHIPSTTDWHLRSYNCLKFVEAPHRYRTGVCGSCRQLTSAHAASCLENWCCFAFCRQASF